MSTTGLAVRPFEVHVPDEDLAGLRQRIAATRWPGKELGDEHRDLRRADVLGGRPERRRRSRAAAA